MTTLSPRRVFEPLAHAADGRTLALAVAAGAAFDLGIRSGVVSVGGAIATAGAAGALAASRRIETGVGRACLGVAVVFAPFLAWRTSPWLVTIDLFVIVGALASGALLARDATVTGLGPRHLAGRTGAALRPALTGVAFLAAPVRRWLAADGMTAQRRAGLVGVARGAVLAVPILLVLGGLLASADAVFANFARVDHVLPADLWLHVSLVVAGSVLIGGLLRVASTTPGDAVAELGWRLRVSEWTVVLGGVVALFAAFAAAQVMAVSEGGERVLATEGLTYAEYARTGYFQLLAVAGLTAALLIVLANVADRSTASTQHRFAILAGLAVVLTLAILAVALRRLGLYEEAYGWTMLRLMVKASAVWLGVAFALLGVRLAGVAPDRSWLLPSVTGAALVIALILNLADPEAAVVRHNVERGAAGHDVDPEYLTRLSDDAVPTLVDALPLLSPIARAGALAQICTGTHSRSGLSWNRSTSRASAARERVCP
jgi:hypothetical protein